MFIQTNNNSNSKQNRVGFVALIGAPNVGKSTLINRLIEQKIAIVTHKGQTTRAPLRGIMHIENSQIILIDTPGLFSPHKKFDHMMVNSAWHSAKTADLTLLLIEAKHGITGNVDAILNTFNQKIHTKKTTLIINKIDRVAANLLLGLSQALNERGDFDASFMISAKKGYGIHDLKTYLAQSMPTGEWLYPKDQIADVHMHFMTAEITREKTMLRLHQEVPYNIKVETVHWKHIKQRVHIEQEICISHTRYKPIVLGAQGQTIKAIGQAARQDIQDLLNKPVDLFLKVVVDPNWFRDQKFYQRIGL